MSDREWRRFTAKRRAKRRARRARAIRIQRRNTRRAVARKRLRSKRKATRRSRVSKRRSVTSQKRRSVNRRSKRRSVARRFRNNNRRSVKRKRVRKYSKKWWANHRASQRRKKAVASRKRAMRLRQMRLAKKKAAQSTPASARYSRIKTAPSAAPNQVRTRVQSPNAVPVQQVATGDVSVDVFGVATGQTVTKGRNTLLGGVSTTTLRRTVIDQMIQDSGWVENDYHKEIAGKKVYVVVAKAPDQNNRVQSRTYYFTESNGRIYRVATRSSESADESAQKRSEEAIRSLERAARPQQARN